MSEHTPTPWEVQTLSHAHDELWLQIGHFGRGPIVELNCTAHKMEPGVIAEARWLCTSEDEQKANAAFIVRACNAHDDLVAALRELADDHGRLCQRVGLSENETRDSAVLNHKAHAALAKASA